MTSVTIAAVRFSSISTLRVTLARLIGGRSIVTLYLSKHSVGHHYRAVGIAVYIGAC